MVIVVTNLLFVGSSSVLVEGGQVCLVVSRTQTDGLCVTLDGLLILPSLEVLVALVLSTLGPVQSTLQNGMEGELVAP